MKTVMPKLKPKVVEYAGRVVKGDGYGRKLGFPTANLDRRQWSRQKLKLKYGVYGGTARLPSGQTHLAGIVVGPADSRGLPKVEAYLVGFKGNLYGKRIILEIREFIRPYKNFVTIAALKLQIKKDVEQIKKLKQ